MTTRRNPLSKHVSPSRVLMRNLQLWAKRHHMPIWGIGEMEPGFIRMLNDFPAFARDGNENWPKAEPDPRAYRAAMRDLKLVAERHGYVFKSRIFSNAFDFKSRR